MFIEILPRNGYYAQYFECIISFTLSQTLINENYIFFLHRKVKLLAQNSQAGPQTYLSCNSMVRCRLAFNQLEIL